MTMLYVVSARPPTLAPALNLEGRDTAESGGWRWSGGRGSQSALPGGAVHLG